MKKLNILLFVLCIFGMTACVEDAELEDANIFTATTLAEVKEGEVILSSDLAEEYTYQDVSEQGFRITKVYGSGEHELQVVHVESFLYTLTGDLSSEMEITAYAYFVSHGFEYRSQPVTFHPM